MNRENAYVLVKKAGMKIERCDMFSVFTLGTVGKHLGLDYVSFRIAI